MIRSWTEGEELTELEGVIN